jgi:survival of motor neuron-related-splicing factor 30
LQAELKDMISLLNESIAELKPKQAPKPAVQKPPTPPPQEKWSRENHPAFKKAAPPPEEKDESVAVTYQVNDTVLAKWVSGDKAFYPARITSITGSSTAPIYIVKFKSYDTTETLRAKDIRPVTNKRKADGTTVTSSNPSTSSSQPPQPAATAVPTSNNGVVLSAAANLYPEQQAKKEAEKNTADESAKPPKPKKIKANKELEAGKSKWQEFSSKSKFGKSQKRDSMFRTPDGIHGRGALKSDFSRSLSFSHPSYKPQTLISYFFFSWLHWLWPGYEERPHKKPARISDE